LEGGYKMPLTIRELEEFLKTLPDDIKDSPVVIENDEVQQFDVRDCSHTYGKKTGHKLCLEFSYDDERED
jgi:hypothetical protein